MVRNRYPVELWVEEKDDSAEAFLVVAGRPIVGADGKGAKLGAKPSKEDAFTEALRVAVEASR
jgi:CRISPR/Cas system-associated endonuclease Cas3-HD